MLNKTAMITGGASGLGKSITNQLLSEGWTIGIIDNNEQALLAFQESQNTMLYGCDILDSRAITNAVLDFKKHAKNIDLFINNAGAAGVGLIQENSIDDWKKIYDVNVFGTVNATKAILPILKQQGTGHIHFVSSAASFSSLSGMAIYNSSKAAIVSLAETLKCELINDPIQVSVSIPTFFKTNLIKNMRGSEKLKTSIKTVTMNSNYSANQAAKDILEGIMKNEFYIFAPKRVKYLWRFKRFFPLAYLKKITSIMQKKSGEEKEIKK